MINLLTSNNVTNYKIYLVNEGSGGENFWCFLQQPKMNLTGDVFANSNTSLFVIPNYQGTNKFTIPLQYTLGAGASNNAVGLNIQIDSAIMKDVSLEDIWDVKYATAPPKQGPNISLEQGTKSSDGTIGAKSNNFDKVTNENNKWFSNMNFGIQTANGFIGITWSPSPSNTTTITPKFAFYVSTGNYTSNDLADLTTISNKSAKIELSNFKNLEATVTLTSRGEWLVTPGAPKK